MKLSANQAAKEAGIAKKTLLDALKTGKISGTKNEQGHWEIDRSDLWKVASKTPDHQSREQSPTPSDNTENRIELARLQAALEAATTRIEDKDSVIDDLRTRLDAETADRKATQARLEDLRDKTAPLPHATASSASASGKRGFWARLFG